MATWRHTVQHRVYAPRALLRAGLWDQLVDFGIAVVDTSESLEQGTSPHPFVLREAAVHRVQKDREVAERELAERWCALETEPLFVDGSISGSDGVARGSCAVGVVKSHRTLYASDDALNTVLRLRHAERSSVFSVTSPRRATVASWYLRMRDPAGRDPMWGLVRVEVGENEAGTAKGISARADEVSRWILAEAAPLALPDPRWDRMVYGIRDCEEFLKAIQG